MTNEQKKFLREIILSSNNIVFFGGAGVSTASGIPDFRSKDGLYNNKDVKFEKYEPEYLLDRHCLYCNPKIFYEFYRQKMDTRNIEPNITHKVLARMENMGKLKAVVTQNIDGLHQKAGSKIVYEIHGTTQRAYCTKCKKTYPYDAIFESKEDIPRCDCTYRGMIRPDVVLYGEDLPVKECNDANKALNDADCLIVAGTSLQVQPAASFIYSFHGEHLIVVNREKLKIMLSPDNDLEINEDMSEVFEYINTILDEIEQS